MEAPAQHPLSLLSRLQENQYAALSEAQKRMAPVHLKKVVEKEIELLEGSCKFVTQLVAFAMYGSEGDVEQRGAGTHRGAAPSATSREEPAFLIA